MGRGRSRFRFRSQREDLERRDLPAVAALVASPDPSLTPVPANLFHRNGINGFQLDKPFIDLMSARNTVAREVANRISQAFQVFAANYPLAPVNHPGGGFGTPSPSAPQPTPVLGNPTMPITVPNLLGDLTHFVTLALSTYEVLTSEVRPWQENAPKYTPRAQLALIPFAQAQIAQLGATLAAAKPVVGPQGKLVNPDPTPALNATANAILNAVAENTLHPALFLTPNDFYLNPNVKFTYTFTSVPAQAAPGFFIRGPGGAFLPGATLHPHAPN
jgi:hypothetical protein